MSSLRNLAFAGLMAATASAASIEVDIIFPRNQTYIAPDVIPIAVSVQNLSALTSSASNVAITWDLVPYSNGTLGESFDSGTFTLPGTIGEEPVVLVGATNVGAWLSKAKVEDRISLQVFANWDGSSAACGGSGDLGNLMFNVETLEQYNENNKTGVYDDAVTANLTEISDCPAFGGIVDYEPLATPVTTELASTTATCAFSLSYSTTPYGGTPCAKVLDVAEKTSIFGAAQAAATSASASQASVAATATGADKTGSATATGSAADSTSSSGAGAVRAGAALPLAAAAAYLLL